MLEVPGTTPKRSDKCCWRGQAYRVLNEERKLAGMRPLTIEELNAIPTRWDFFQETSKIMNARKAEPGLFGGAA
jgi:hypothetical protein